MHPRIIISCGDPNGIGPEIMLKLFAKGYFSRYDIVAAGPMHVFDYYSRKLRIKNIPCGRIMHIGGYENFRVSPGTEDSTAGRISGDAISIGTHLCLAGKFQALVTMPVSKKTLNSGGYRYNGHTEMLADISGVKDTVMMLCTENIMTAPLTTHIPLKRVASAVTAEMLYDKIMLIKKELRKRFRIPNPSFALLSVNPHSGDGGVTGTEDQDVIEPFVSMMKKKKIKVSGPFSADGYFGYGKYKDYDITIGMYHDQIMIPFKILAKGRGVNYTAGLPFVRTSPAHGTAFGIAGKNKAETASTMEAVRLAIKTLSEK